VLEVLYRRAKFGAALISPAAGVAKNVVFFLSVCLFVCLFVCLSVCLFVTLLNVRDFAPDFAVKALEYRNDFDFVGYGRFVVVHPCSAFLDCCQLATALNAEVQKWLKLGFFSNRRNLACTRVPRVCYSTPNLALIGKRGSVHETTKGQKFAHNCGFWPSEADTVNTFR